MSTLITPRTLSGFRDYLPDVMIARERVLQTARDVYRSYGFTPIDTPGLRSARRPARQGRRGVGQARLSRAQRAGARRRRWACGST